MMAPSATSRHSRSRSGRTLKTAAKRNEIKASEIRADDQRYRRASTEPPPPPVKAPVATLAAVVTPAGHGAPVRLVAPGRRGFIWVKWVTRIELHDEPDPGAFAATVWSSFTPPGRGS